VNVLLGMLGHISCECAARNAGSHVMLVSWSLTSLFSTNMAISETNMSCECAARNAGSSRECECAARNAGSSRECECAARNAGSHVV